MSWVLKTYFYLLFEYFVHMCFCTQHVCLVFGEAWSGYQIPWNLSCRWLWAVMVGDWARSWDLNWVLWKSSKSFCLPCHISSLATEFQRALLAPLPQLSFCPLSHQGPPTLKMFRQGWYLYISASQLVTGHRDIPQDLDGGLRLLTSAGLRTGNDC